MLNKIYKKDNNIFRVLKIEDNKLLIIDCVKRSFPIWVDNNFLDGFEVISEDELLKELNVELPNVKDLSENQVKEMHLRFGSISLPLIKIGNIYDRRFTMYFNSLEYEVSEQTLRRRLCDYLVFQNIAILAPVSRKSKELTQDEKNFRWALNKYFYNSKKLSLRQTYKYLLREKYMDSAGKIIEEHPTFHQFRYFYYKNRSESNYIISRMGRGEYERNYRPLLGEGVREFCPSIGYGMVDSTTCDIYLVDDNGELLGRPIMTACVDAYSSMCLGYSIGFEGGIKSLQKLMLNVVSNKVELCNKYGIEINKEDWDCDKLPHKLITDKGKEYVGDTFSQLTDLGVEILNLKPFRPELKSVVERFFGLVQDLFKKELINCGVVLKDFGDRGAIDYRKNACLTLSEFEKVLLLCIMHYNCGRIIDLPKDKLDIKPHAKDLWNSCLGAHRDTLIEADKEILRLTLLPRGVGKFNRNGLIINKLRYKADGFINDYLKGGEVVVAYDPNNVSKVWLYRNNKYIEFELIDSFFENLDLGSVEEIIKRNNSEFEIEELESEIRLNKDIDSIINKY